MEYETCLKKVGSLFEKASKPVIYQPLVCIGGHMHEHFTKCKIGKTIAINVGFGPYANVWLELSDNKIKRLEFYMGVKD